MTEHEFIEKLVEIMDTEYPLAMDTKLEDVEEWDSLSYVTFLAMCKGEQKHVEPQRILVAKTVADLYDVVLNQA